MSKKFSSKKYWKDRYNRGKTSGKGSYGDRAIFKTDVLNEFIKKNNIKSIIDLGCGDGNIASMLNIEKYVGLDISKTAMDTFKERNPDKEVLYYSRNNIKNLKKTTNDLVMSIDVLFHLIEKSVFKQYLQDLFALPSKYVIIYSSNQEVENTEEHVKHIKFLPIVRNNFKNFELKEIIENKCGGRSNFYIFEKKNK